MGPLAKLEVDNLARYIMMKDGGRVSDLPAADDHYHPRQPAPPPVKAKKNESRDSGIGGGKEVNTSDEEPEIHKYITDTNDHSNYVKGKFLGKGGFARVHELIDMRTNLAFAGKVIAKTRISKQHHKEKIDREIELHRSLQHRNVVQFIKHFEDVDFIYIILENCTRKSLVHILKVRNTVTEPETRYFMSQLVQGVEYIHSQKIIHRDLKLGNLFLTGSMAVKIGDFGLATRVGLEKKGTICGTPNYISPEVLNKEGHGFEADVWALGCVMFALLVGQPPFETSTLKETYQRIADNQFTIPNEVSPTAAALIRRLLHPDPGCRPRVPVIIADPFFSSGYFPTTLSSTCCSQKPIFPELPENHYSPGNIKRFRTSVHIGGLPQLPPLASLQPQKLDINGLTSSVHNLAIPQSNPSRSSPSSNIAINNHNSNNMTGGSPLTSARHRSSNMNGGSPLTSARHHSNNINGGSSPLTSARRQSNNMNGGGSPLTSARHHSNNMNGGGSPLTSERHHSNNMNGGSPLTSVRHLSNSPLTSARHNSNSLHSVYQAVSHHQSQLGGQLPQYQSCHRIEGGSSCNSPHHPVSSQAGSPFSAARQQFKTKKISCTGSVITSCFGNSPQPPFSPYARSLPNSASNSSTGSSSSSSCCSSSSSSGSGSNNSSLVLCGLSANSALFKSKSMSLHSAIRSSLSIMPPNKDLNPLSLSNFKNTPLFITKWIDYSNKYGFGFQLSDRSIGVLFNDTTRMTYGPDRSFVQYSDGYNITTISLAHHSVPPRLMEKFTLLRYFAQYMDENLTEGGDYRLPSSSARRHAMLSATHENRGPLPPAAVMPQLRRWIRTPKAIIMHLTNGTVQVNYFKDHSKMIVDGGPEHLVTFINPERQLCTWALGDLARHGASFIVREKLAYVAKILLEFVELEQQTVNV